MGLRWEYDGLLGDKYGHLTQVWLNRMAPNASLPPTLADALSGPLSPLSVQQYVVPSNFGTSYPMGPPAGVGFATNRNSIEGHAPYGDFAPRFGFAWQPLSGGKLVIRGGVGIFYDRVGLDRVVHAFEQGNPYATTYDFGAGSTRALESTLADPYPQIQLVCMPGHPTCNTDPNGLGFAARYADPTTGASSGLNTPYVPTTVHTPLVREYSLGFQYEFVHGWVLDLGYVGSSGINLTDYNHNHNGALLFSPCSGGAATCASDPYGFCSGANVGQTCNTGGPVGNVNSRVPYLGYEPIGLQASDFDGYSNYNSLQATVRHQFSHGLSLQAAYTWDKNLSDIFYANTADINNALCVKCQYGRTSFDRPQRLVVNYSYDLPFGKGTEGITKKLIDGWNVSGVTIAQSGDPSTFINPGNPFLGTSGTGTAYGTSTALSFQGVSTAQFCPGFGSGQVKTPGSTEKNLNSYWNFSAFGNLNPVTGIFIPCLSNPVPNGDATALDYGNSGVGIALGPGQFNWDISILKNTQITERVRMQFRADFYNAFNHPQFADPGAGSFGSIGFQNVSGSNGPFPPDFLTTTFGQITHTSVNPRLIQFGLHFTF